MPIPAQSQTPFAFKEAEWKKTFDGNSLPYAFTEQDADRVGNWISLGPAGDWSELEALLLAVLAKKLTETPAGIRALSNIATTYLDNMGRIITAMQHASATNWMNAMMNLHVCANIYARMGLMSPRDQYQTHIFLDHVFAEMIKKGYITETVGALTTLVNASTTTTGKVSGTSGIANLAALAKLYGGK